MNMVIAHKSAGNKNRPTVEKITEDNTSDNRSKEKLIFRQQFWCHIIYTANTSYRYI